ncbi:MAG TPA: NADPH-dependent F420 reductase [Chloroflexota bacterium]|nr:NADPH-dependent F420 reductase [Chloroflexota bacterium]
MSSGPETTIALIGGTGPEGRGLALRFASAGIPVVIGSRSEQRASQTAGELAEALGGRPIVGADNREAAARAGLVVLTVPYAGVPGTVPFLKDVVAGKIVVSAVAPFEWMDGKFVPIAVPEGSAAQVVQAMLPASRVVSAFQTIDAFRLHELDSSLDTDVIVCSDDADARHEVMDLAARLPGVRALSGGRLAASRYVESVTGLLITINRIYKAHSGIHITGVNR